MVSTDGQVSPPVSWSVCDGQWFLRVRERLSVSLPVTAASWVKQVARDRKMCNFPTDSCEFHTGGQHFNFAPKFPQTGRFPARLWKKIVGREDSKVKLGYIIVRYKA